MPIKPMLRGGELERMVQSLKDAHELLAHFAKLTEQSNPGWSSSAKAFANGSEWVMKYNIVSE